MASNIALGQPDATAADIARAAAAGRGGRVHRGAARRLRRRRSASAAPGCPRASGSGSRWPGRSSGTPRCCCWTSRSRTWTRSPPGRSSDTIGRLMAGPDRAAGHPPPGLAAPRARTGRELAARSGPPGPGVGLLRAGARRRRAAGGHAMTAAPAHPAASPPVRRRRRPLLRLLRLARPLRGQLVLAVLAGALSTGCAVALLGTSGFLLARASQHPNIVAISVAVVAVRGLSRRPRGVPLRASGWPRTTRPSGCWPTSGSGSTGGWSGSPRPGCATSGPVTCWPGWSATWTPPRTCSSAGIAPPLTAVLVGAGAAAAVPAHPGPGRRWCWPPGCWWPGWPCPGWPRPGPARRPGAPRPPAAS